MRNATEKRGFLQYHRMTTDFSRLEKQRKQYPFLYYTSSLRFLLLFIIREAIILPLLALRKTEEIIETKLAPERPLHANLRAKIAGRSPARRGDADVRQ